MNTREHAQPRGESRRAGTAGSNHRVGTKYSAAYFTPPAGIEGILRRLDGVKPTGSDRWIAKCPAHDDRSPSLSIRDTGDRVLIHCHASCSAIDIVAAVGLELRDLYRDALPAGERRKLAVQASVRDLEAAVHHELLILMQTLGQRVIDRQVDRRGMPPEWKPMPPGYWERELAAVRRIMRLFPQVYGPELVQGGLS